MAACAIGGGCLSDAGYSAGEALRAGAVATAATIRKVAAAAIALDNANRLIDNYKDQRDIARRTLAIAERQQEQLRTVYWPREAQFLNEFANPEALETVEAVGRRLGGRMAAAVSAAFARQLKETRCAFARYCTSANKKAMQDLLMARAAGIANARVLGRNIAFADYQARQDTNLERRAQAVAIGRNLLQQAATLYAKAGDGLANVGGILSGQLSSALESFGYAGARSANVPFNGTVAQGQYEYLNRQRPGTTMPAGGSNNIGPYADSYGYPSSTTQFWNPEASNTFGNLGVGSGASALLDSGQPEMRTNMQNERQMHEGDVGNRDKARVGFYTFPVIGGSAVVVNMGMFPLEHVDAYQPGSYGPIFGVI